MKKRKKVLCILSALAIVASVFTGAIGARAAGTAEAAADENALGDASVLKVTAIDFGDTGWGDGTMIESGGECLLMDTFMPDCADALKRFLEENGYKKFGIYLSHYHADHFGNIRRIMRDDSFTITGIYLPDDAHLWPTDHDYGAEIGWFMDVDQGIRELAGEMNIPLTVLHPGDSFRVGDALVEILYGTTYESDDHNPSYLNNNSLVARVSGGGIRYLTCGDIEKTVEERILEEGIDISADLYKMSHHGGGTSNSYSFLQAVNPSFAFFNSLEDSPDDFAADWAEGPVSDMMDFANVHSSRYNGNITYTAKDGVITVRAQRNTDPRILTYKADGAFGFCMTFQQFNDAQAYKDTDKMKEAAAAVIRSKKGIPAVYR